MAAAVLMSPTPFLPIISTLISGPFRPNSSRASSLSFTGAFRSTTTTGVDGVIVRAADNSNGEDPPFLSEEDLTYLGKLGAGSVVGAAAIKYGSAIFPEITRPDLIEALVIITFPVVLAVLLLLRQSLSTDR